MTVTRAVSSLGVGIALMLCVGPASAQFGGLFDPPRPPSSVPTRPPAQQPAQPSPQYQPPPPPPQGRIQSEELPPPTGAQPTALPRPGAAPPPGQQLPPAQLPPPPGQRPQRAGTPPVAPPGSPAPVAAAPPPPPDDVVTPPPPQRITNPTAVFSGLDKITGRITAFDAAIGETVQFGALQVTARACYSRPPTETPLTDGFVEVDEVTLQGEVRRIFTGWMFATSPGLHAVEHAIYDVWLTDCKGGAQAVADAQPPAPAPAAPARPAPGQKPSTSQRSGSAQAQPTPRQTLPPPGTQR